MRTLIWGKTFVRSLKRTAKKYPSLNKEIQDALRLLQKDPFASRLATHKLKGKLAGSWACSVGYDLRIVFDFVRSSGQQEDDILLLEIGSHDEVY
jgi:addiction module RelE/StbE family toxin